MRRSTSKKMIMIAAAIIIISVSIHLNAFDRVRSGPGLDLQQDWTLCEPELSTSGCRWTPIDLLKVHNPQVHKDKYSEVIYRRSFLSPQFCFDERSEGCQIIIGGVYQGAEIELNGISLGTHFTKADLYPASFKVPMVSLRRAPVENVITLKVYQRESLASLAAVVQGPIGVYPNQSAKRIIVGIVGERIALPLISGVACLILALIALYWMLSKNASPKILNDYVFYCLTAFGYMIFATRIPRELLSFSLGRCMNYGSRTLADYGLFVLVVSYFGFETKGLKVIRWIFKTWIGFYLCVAVSVVVSAHVDQVLSTYRLNINGLTGLRQPDVLYLLAAVATPFWILASGMGLMYSARTFGRDPKNRVLFVLFLPLFLMQTADILTFLGIIRNDHEIYYLRLYNPFVAMGFGYAIWMKWIERERISEAIEKVGHIASAVAHDLRTPLAVLKVLVKASPDQDVEKQSLLLGAIQSIDKISSSLLSTYRATLIGNIFCGKSGNFESIEIVELVQDVIQARNYVLIEQGFLPIELAVIDSTLRVVKITVDAFELRRALNNLISNALDAVVDKNRPQVSVALEKQGRSVAVSIRDNGDGFPTDFLPEFSQHEFGRSSKPFGHGIGLFRVWEIVKAHKGQLRIFNIPDGGACVEISLPI